MICKVWKEDRFVFFIPFNISPKLEIEMALPIAGPIYLKTIIDRILAPDCPPVPIQGPIDGGCLAIKGQQVAMMIQQLLLTANPYTCPRILDTPVLTFVPGQGMTMVTILEAAIIMRMPNLVGYILQLGANPNMSTAGIPLVAQIPGISPAEQAIIELLLNFGSYPPPGYPGTRGFYPNMVRSRALDSGPGPIFAGQRNQ